MSERAVEIESLGSVAWIWLSRPEVHNAFDAALIEQLTHAYARLEEDPTVRLIILSARGKSFCAGAHAGWMQEQGSASFEQNVSGARRMAHLFQTIAQCAKPTIARVHGAALGGGVGLVAACDIALGSRKAVFGTTEIRLGLIPATIGPYVVRAIGERQARRYFQTGERFDAMAAERMGLLHEVVEPEDLDRRLKEIVASLLAGAPSAQKEAKELIDSIAGHNMTAAVTEDTAQRIAKRRADAEAREGLSAFLEKRPAAWVLVP